MIKKYWIYFLFAFSIIVFVVVKITKKTPSTATENNTVLHQLALSLKIVKSGTGFGYEILNGSKPMIRQLTVPAINAAKPFATATDAEKTGSLVMKKAALMVTPSVSINELDSMKIVY